MRTAAVGEICTVCVYISAIPATILRRAMTRAESHAQAGAGARTEKSSDPHGHRNRRWREITKLERAGRSWNIGAHPPGARIRSQYWIGAAGEAGDGQGCGCPTAPGATSDVVRITVVERAQCAPRREICAAGAPGPQARAERRDTCALRRVSDDFATDLTHADRLRPSAQTKGPVRCYPDSERGAGRETEIADAIRALLAIR